MAQSTVRPERSVASPRSVALWFGVLGPPVAWATHLVLGDLIYELGCAPGNRASEFFGISLHTWSVLQTAVLAAVTVLAGVLAFRAGSALREQAEESVAVERARAMAWAGMASAVLYLMIMAFGLTAPLVLPPCAPPL